MIIAVAGSSGFVGKALIKALELKGYIVLKLDIENGDNLARWETINRQIKFDTLINLAAKTYVPASFETPREFLDTNILSTLNLLELCRENKAKMINISSYVYGTPKYLPIDESHPTVSFNPYSESKLIGENLCNAYFRDFSVKSIIIRPFNIYGPGQNINFLIPTILKQALSGSVVLQNSKSRRDMLYIDDFIELLIRAINYTPKTNEVFNAGFGESYSVKEIVNEIQKYFSNKLEVKFLEKYRKNEVMDTVANITKAKKQFNWEPNIKLSKGIENIFNCDYKGKL